MGVQAPRRFHPERSAASAYCSLPTACSLFSHTHSIDTGRSLAQIVRFCMAYTTLFRLFPRTGSRGIRAIFRSQLQPQSVAANAPSTLPNVIFRAPFRSSPISVCLHFTSAATSRTKRLVLVSDGGRVAQVLLNSGICGGVGVRLLPGLELAGSNEVYLLVDSGCTCRGSRHECRRYFEGRGQRVLDECVVKAR